MERENQAEDGPGTNRFNYDRIEETIDVVQEDLDAFEDQVDDAFQSDIADLENRLEHLEDAVDDAQDNEGENPVGSVPAQLDYLQRTVAILKNQTGVDGPTDVDQGLEAIEEEFEGVQIQQTQWYAQVDGIPQVYDEREVRSHQLKQQGDVEGDTDEFTVKALPTPTADLSENIANFPDDDMEVDLGEFTNFRTEKQEGGVV